MQDIYQLLSARNIGIAMLIVFVFVHCMFYARINKLKAITIKETVVFWALFIVVLVVGMFLLTSETTGIFPKTWAVSMFLFMTLVLKLQLRAGQNKILESMTDTNLLRG